MSNIQFTKDNLDAYLKELGKEFRKLNGTKVPAEIILVGGASVLINYGFRDITYDIDAIIQASSSMKDAINKVRDKMNLSNGWLNEDFIRTDSYSPKLIQYSEYYRTFSNVLRVRIVSSKYLLVMKLMSGREYKNDLSDAIGILWEQKERGDEIALEDIKQAAFDLYGGYDKLPESSREFIEDAYTRNDLYSYFKEIQADEKSNKESLVSFQEDYPGVLNGENVKEILAIAKARDKNK